MNSSITNLSARQLRRAAAIKEKVQSLERELGRLLGAPAMAAAKAAPRRRMSAAARARMAAAARARWAKVKGKKNSAPKRRSRMSAAAKRRLSILAKARWAKIKAGKKSK